MNKNIYLLIQVTVGKSIHSQWEIKDEKGCEDQRVLLQSSLGSEELGSQYL